MPSALRTPTTPPQRFARCFRSAGGLLISMMNQVFFTVGGHGQLLHDKDGSVLTVEQLAAKIRSAGWDGTSSIKLLSCNTGMSQDYCQDLANLLGVSVFAADTLVWYIATDQKWYAWLWGIFSDDEDVKLITGGTVAPYQRREDDPLKPDYSKPGRFIEFKPE